MNKLLLIIPIILLSIVLSLGQGLPDDDYFPLDDSVASTVESVEIFGSPLLGKGAPKKASLRAKIPPIGNMNTAPAGESLGWAIGYYATSMVYSLKPGEVLSPYFLFDMLTKANPECRLPTAMYMKELKRILFEVGCVRITDYPTRGNCTVKPNRAVYQNKQRYRAVLNTILAARTGEGLSNTEVQYAIRRRVDAGMPVIGIIKADKTFKNLNSEVWISSQDSRLYTHAVVIIGYDDIAQEIEVVNCLGKNWGAGGVAKIKYNDLYHFQQLFQITKHTETPIARVDPKPTLPQPIPPREKPEIVANVPASKPKPRVENDTPRPTPQPPLVQLAGTVRLRIPIRTGDQEALTFENVRCTYTNGLFEAASWSIGQQFQLAIDRLTPGSYVYLFSVDGHGEATIHWPQRAALGNLAGTPFSALVSDQGTSFLLPRPRLIEEQGLSKLQERVFTKDVQGTDYLVMLHSAKELDDAELKVIVNEVSGRYTSTEFMKRLRSSLGKRRLSNPGIKSVTGPIGYVARGSEGYIVPVVLKID